MCRTFQSDMNRIFSKAAVVSLLSFWTNKYCYVNRILFPSLEPRYTYQKRVTCLVSYQRRGSTTTCSNQAGRVSKVADHCISRAHACPMCLTQLSSPGCVMRPIDATVIVASFWTLFPSILYSSDVTKGLLTSKIFSRANAKMPNNIHWSITFNAFFPAASYFRWTD